MLTSRKLKSWRVSICVICWSKSSRTMAWSTAQESRHHRVDSLSMHLCRLRWLRHSESCKEQRQKKSHWAPILRCNWSPMMSTLMAVKTLLLRSKSRTSIWHQGPMARQNCTSIATSGLRISIVLQERALKMHLKSYRFHRSRACAVYRPDHSLSWTRSKACRLVRSSTSSLSLILAAGGRSRRFNWSSSFKGISLSPRLTTTKSRWSSSRSSWSSCSATRIFSSVIRLLSFLTCYMTVSIGRCKVPSAQLSELWDSISRLILRSASMALMLQRTLSLLESQRQRTCQRSTTLS